MLGDPERAPLDLRIDILDLELDQRLRDWTPKPHDELWDIFRPSGRLSVGLRIVREREGGPLGYGMGIDCRDVAMVYKFFKYPLDHVRGQIIWQGQKVNLDIQTLVGGKPLKAKGTIDNPGDPAHVAARLRGGGTADRRDAVRRLARRHLQGRQGVPADRLGPGPRARRSDSPRPGPTTRRGGSSSSTPSSSSKRARDEMGGASLPGREPDRRARAAPGQLGLQEHAGSNGQAVIIGFGQGRAACSRTSSRWTSTSRARACRSTTSCGKRYRRPGRRPWATINPYGSCDVEATIQVGAGQPDFYHLVIDPGPSRASSPGSSRVPRPKVDPGGMIEMRMEDVKGRFIFDNGIVKMHDVGFKFHDAPVEFARGHGRGRGQRRFGLGVYDLRRQDFRLDSRLRDKMPPIMADFARRLDEGKTFRVNGNLKLSWSGKLGDPPRCKWDHALVVFNDNTHPGRPAAGAHAGAACQRLG